jgi:hypothetical protein
MIAMLENNVIQQEDSIEELFAKKFDKLNKYPMDNETAEIFIKLRLSKNSSYVIPEDDKPFLYKVMEKRISVIHSYTVDDRVLLFLSFVSKSAGICVMYCWYLQYKSKTMNINHISFEVFSEIFAWGFPSQESLSKIWKEQKVNTQSLSSDNLLDYPRAGKSLFKAENDNI